MVYNWQKTIMKKLLILFSTLIVSLTAFTQQQLAILNHNDTISAFYGIDALSQAHNAAVKGDVITLSAGLFNAITVTKQVTIRGAGMWPVDSLNIENTVISGNMTLNVPFDSNYVLTMEGMKFLSYVNYSQAFYPVFKKCRFTDVFNQSSNGTMTGAQFVQCVLYSYSGRGLTGTQFINSVILDLSAPSSLDHCVAKISPSFSTLTSMIVYNSVVYDKYERQSSYNGTYNISGEDYNSSACYYSIGINVYNGNTYGGNKRYFDVTNVVGHHLWNKNAYNQVFKYFDGTYSEGMSMELKDDVAASYLGDDSTQVGIYGGLYPFDPVVHPVIGTLNVARRTNNDQKLEVTIDLINEE